MSSIGCSSSIQEAVKSEEMRGMKSYRRKADSDEDSSSLCLFLGGNQPEADSMSLDGTTMTAAQILADKGAHLFTCGYENSSRYLSILSECF